jgi:hypothetical protein
VHQYGLVKVIALDTVVVVVGLAGYGCFLALGNALTQRHNPDSMLMLLNLPQTARWWWLGVGVAEGYPELVEAIEVAMGVAIRVVMGAHRMESVMRHATWPHLAVAHKLLAEAATDAQQTWAEMCETMTASSLPEGRGIRTVERVLEGGGAGMVARVAHIRSRTPWVVVVVARVMSISSTPSLYLRMRGSLRSSQQVLLDITVLVVLRTKKQDKMALCALL